MVALDKCDLQMLWFDSRRPVENINLEAVHSMIFNIPSRTIPCWPGRHWFTVLKTENGSFMNLDSKLRTPEPVQDIISFTRRLFENLEDKVQLILVSDGDPERMLSRDSSN